jgi:hypothetical protein
MTPTEAQQTLCGNCGASTAWDNSEKYELFKAHMKRTVRSYRFRGMGEILLGCLCLLALISLFVLPLQAGIFVHFGLLGGFITLFVDGIIRILRSREIARFE